MYSFSFILFSSFVFWVTATAPRLEKTATRFVVTSRNVTRSRKENTQFACFDFFLCIFCFVWRFVLPQRSMSMLSLIYMMFVYLGLSQVGKQTFVYWIRLGFVLTSNGIRGSFKNYFPEYIKYLYCCGWWVWNIEALMS